MGEISGIMNAEGSMSSAQEVEGGLVSVLFPEKKGGEIGLPKCVHFHVANSTFHLLALPPPKDRCSPSILKNRYYTDPGQSGIKRDCRFRRSNCGSSNS